MSLASMDFGREKVRRQSITHESRCKSAAKASARQDASLGLNEPQILGALGHLGGLGDSRPRQVKVTE
jgi:hypothetical protein